MVSEKHLRETFLKKFLQLWRERSILAKRGQKIVPGVKVATRVYGIRKQLPKVVTNETVEQYVTEFLKREVDKGFMENNKGEFYIKHIPYMEIMLETIDKNEKPTGLLERPLIAIYAEAGFTPA